MAIRNQTKLSTLPIVPGVHLDLNPFAQAQGSARLLTNFIPEQSRLTRKAPSLPFSSADISSLVHPSANFSTFELFNFRYVRAGARENKLLRICENGRIYERKPGWEQEIFPGTTSFAILTKRPIVLQLSNRLFFSDGISSYVYDGRSVRVWGLARSTTAPAVTAANVAGAIVAATGVKGCFTWVVLDEASNRVHESSRSNINASFVVIGGADDAVTLDVTGLTAPSGATHWSGYISELDGSEVYRRTNTTLLTTFTYTATAFPASTSPKAPIRNDPPPPSTVGCVAKNRIFLRDDANPNTWYFSALGEVKGLLNGAADESFCGYGTNSISDISNSDFIPDREIRAMAEHENAVFIFSESKGYAIVGELNLLDNRSPRSVVKIQQFPEGCLSGNSIASTPFGLAWVAPGRKTWLWPGTAELIEISRPLKEAFDVTVMDDDSRTMTFSTALLRSAGIVNSTFTTSPHLRWYGGNGRQWLILNSTLALASDMQINYMGAGEGSQQGRNCHIFDFSLPSRMGDGRELPGSWFTWVDIIPGPSGIYQDDEGHVFLLMNDALRSMYLCDVQVRPAYLAESMKLGATYLGTIQNCAVATMQTGLISPANGQWCVGNYLELQYGSHISPTMIVGTFTNPTVTSWVDVESPDAPSTGITLTIDTALVSNDRRAWLQPQSAGNTNIGGALARSFIFQLQWAAGADNFTGSDPYFNTLYKAALSFSPMKEMSR